MRINRQGFLVWASRLPNVKHHGSESKMDAGRTSLVSGHDGSPHHRRLFGRQEDMAQGGGLVICPGSCDDFEAESVVSRAPGGPVRHPSLLKPDCPLLSDLGNEAVL